MTFNVPTLEMRGTTSASFSTIFSLRFWILVTFVLQLFAPCFRKFTLKLLFKITILYFYVTLSPKLQFNVFYNRPQKINRILLRQSFFLIQICGLLHHIRRKVRKVLIKNLT